MNKIKAWCAGIKNKKIVVIVVAIAVVIVVLALIWWFTWGEYRSPRAAFAPSGQLISGFPKELILDQTALIDKSYTIGYAYNLNQYTATWNSSSSMDGLYNQYLNYFTSHGWTITNSSNNITAFRGVYAVTSTADTNVVMDDSGQGGLKVTVSYVKK
jgi:hypothetical protein